MDVSEDRGTPKSSISIGFSIIFTIHLFLETPKSLLLDETTKNLLPSLIDSRYRDAVSLRCGSWTLKKSMWRRLPPQMAIVCGCCLGGDSWQKGGRRWGGNHCKTMIISIISLGATHFVCSSELPTCFFFQKQSEFEGFSPPCERWRGSFGTIPFDGQAATVAQVGRAPNWRLADYTNR